MIRELSLTECAVVGAGNGAIFLALGAGCASGYVMYQISSFAAPLSTFLGTLLCATGGTAIGFLGGPAGMVFGGLVGGLGGYLLSASFANITAFMGTALLVGVGTYYQANRA